MSIVIPATNAAQSVDSRSCFEQFPVDAFLYKVAFESDVIAKDFIRLVVTSGNSTAQHREFREYHYNDPSISLDNVASFTLRCAPFTDAKPDIAGFVGKMQEQFAVQQSPTWVLGVLAPTAPRRRLYKATDPDDATKRIGVLIEQDDTGRLTQLTWYKTKDTGPVFRSAPATLQFDLVKSSAGAPSTDPKDIGGWVWYYARGVRA